MFFGLTLAALVVGTMFAVWQLVRPGDVEAGEALLLMHRLIRTFNSLIPILGLSTIIAILLSCWLAREEAERVRLLTGAALCFIAAGLITRFLNQPLNARMLEWSPAALPPDWAVQWDQWKRWHLLRLGAGAVGYGLLAAAALLP
jgi:uncharacterized membrane protein